MFGLDGLLALLVSGQAPAGEAPFLLTLPLAPIYLLVAPLLGQASPPLVLIALAIGALVSPPLCVLRPCRVTRRLAMLGAASWLGCTLAACGALV